MSAADEYGRHLVRERASLDASEAVIGLLEAEGVSRAELARRLDVHPATVSRYLNGPAMSVGTLALIADALGRRVEFRFSVNEPAGVSG